MLLLTKELERTIPKIYTNEETPIPDQMVVAKFFDPCGSWTWFVLEGEREDDDFKFYGLVCGHETELGYFCLSELVEVRNRMGLPLERDRHFTPCKLSEIKGFADVTRYLQRMAAHA